MTLFGPYNQDDWDTMLLLRRDIKRLREEDPIEYKEAIDKELYCIDQIKYARYN